MATKDIFSQSTKIIGGMLWDKEAKRQGRRGRRHRAKAWLREINIDPEAWEWSVPRLSSRSRRTGNTEPRAIPRWLYRRVKRMRWMEIESLLCELRVAAGRPFWTRQRLMCHVQPAIDRLVSQGSLVVVREARRHALQVVRRLSDTSGTESG
jgi:hypothetical protein